MGGFVVRRRATTERLGSFSDAVFESPPPVEVFPARDPARHLDKLRTPLYGVTGTVLDGVGRGHAIGSGSCVCICSGVVAAAGLSARRMLREDG